VTRPFCQHPPADEQSHSLRIRHRLPQHRYHNSDNYFEHVDLSVSTARCVRRSCEEQNVIRYYAVLDHKQSNYSRIHELSDCDRASYHIISRVNRTRIDLLSAYSGVFNHRIVFLAKSRQRFYVQVHWAPDVEALRARQRQSPRLSTRLCDEAGDKHRSRIMILQGLTLLFAVCAEFYEFRFSIV